MSQSGQEMLDETIATCKSIADGLLEQNQAWENSIVEIVEKFEEVSETFFFQNNAKCSNYTNYYARGSLGFGVEER